MQQTDPVINKVLHLKEENTTKPPRHKLSGFEMGVKILCTMWDSLYVDSGGILHRKTQSPTTSDEIIQLVVPTEIRKQILDHFHNNRLAGHLGREKTLSLIKKKYFWPGMSKDIRLWCQKCDMCAKLKPGPGKGKSPLVSNLVNGPLDRIAIDIMGPLPETREGNLYIMVVGDYFTKWKEAYAIPNHNALTVADKLVNEFICRFGVPKTIHTDQGREFESELFSNLCSLLNIEKTRTAPYRPYSDGMVERFNRSLQTMLSSFVNDNRNDWDEHLPYVLMGYRASVHESTKCSPNLLMFGREVQFPLDVSVGYPPCSPEPVCPTFYVEWLKQAMRNAHQFAFEHLKVAATRQKKYYDRGLKPRTYKIGQWVWRWYPPTANKNLDQGWTGPYLVIKKMGYVNYQIQKSENSPIVNVHVDHLKPHEGDCPRTSWLRTSVIDDTASDSGSSNSEQLEDVPDLVDVSFPVPAPDSPVPQRTRTGRVVKPREIYSP
ncbi:hypothetical protein FSP39_010526 [Pinctada imbricata]|uniref:Integrase catalytic domain-containing protein n=1 Tax=Pinctada imbricata TaxID=66713 RepID=A0AA89C129_PINIB|nr:hypothetical protein FSP39_010526 [Pinctada imbricata]